MIVKLEDTTYSSAEDKAEFILQSIQETLQETLEECLEVIKYSEEVMLESLIHFCNTGNFLGE